MREFDLEAARRGEPVVTRDGRPARILATDLDSDFPIAVAIRDITGETCSVRKINGRYVSETIESTLDLFMGERTYYANVYMRETGPIIGSAFRTKDAAENVGQRDEDYVKTIEFTA